MQLINNNKICSTSKMKPSKVKLHTCTPYIPTSNEKKVKFSISDSVRISKEKTGLKQGKRNPN